MTDIRRWMPRRVVTPPARRRVSLVDEHILRMAVPLGRSGNDAALYAHAVLMLSLGQCAQDLLVQFCNLPNIKGRFRAEKAEIWGAFDHQRRNLRRGIDDETFAKFEQIICDTTDECERRVAWLIATIKSELAQKVPFGEVDSGSILGIIHGLVQCCNRIHERATGRKSNDYNRVLDYVSEIDGKLGMTLLNEHITPDPTYCVNALMQLVEGVKDAVVARFGKKGGEK